MVNYIPYMDFMAQQVSSGWLFTILFVFMSETRHDGPPLTGGSETKPPTTSPDGPCPLGKDLIWSFYAVSVPPLRTWTLDWSSPGYPHSVGSYCSAVQNQSGTRIRFISKLPIFSCLVYIGRNYSCNRVCKAEIVLVLQGTVEGSE